MNFFEFAWQLLHDQRGEIGDLPPDDNPPADNPDTPTDTPPAQPAAPAFVPTEEFKRFENLVTTGMERLTQSMEALLQSQNQPAPAPTIADVTDEEINTAITSGENPAKVLRRLNAATEARLRRDFDARASQIEEVGYGSLAAQASEIANSRMDAKLRVRFKKEIDQYVGTLSPAMRTRSDTYMIAYNAVIGAHMPELLAEEREAAIRQARNPAPAPTPGANNNRGTGTTGVPTVEEYLGKEVANALESVGRTPDQHAQRMGYKDWADMVKKHQELQ